MINRILYDITNITNDEELHLENYLDSLKYIDKLISVLKIIKKYTLINDLEFNPTFKSKSVASKLGITVFNEETLMRSLEIKSSFFLGDVNSLIEDLYRLNEKMVIKISEDTMTIINKI